VIICEPGAGARFFYFLVTGKNQREFPIRQKSCELRQYNQIFANKQVVFANKMKKSPKKL
jgi:hypothetical protein